MKAVRIHRLGGPEVLVAEDLPKPEPGPGELLIELEAIGVNFVDTQQRQGFPAWYRVPLPFTPGFEAAGKVAAIGDGVDGFGIGDCVAYQGAFGAYAAFASVPADIAVPVPAEIDADTAAAALLQGMTAHYLVNDSYRIEAGDWVLVHAGAGGTGGLAVQMAKARGAVVVSTVSTPEKAAIVRENGADYVIDYARQDFEAEVRALDGFSGLAAVYDSIGQATFEQGLRLLRPRGIMVMYGAASGPVEPFDLNRLNPMGSLFVTRPNVKDYVATRGELLARAGAVFEMVLAGELTVRVGARFALDNAAAAHRAIETRATVGKVLLLP